MYKSIFFLVFLSVCMSCNNSEKETTKTSELESNIDKSKSLVIDFTFKTTETDLFTIMMNNIEVDELQQKNIHVFENITPTTGKETIKAKFDPDNLSKKIVLHLGSNTEKSVEIDRLLISYGDILFNLTSAEDFNKHLVFNKFIERDSTSKTLVTKRIEGKLNPTIRIKNSLINQLKK